MSSDNNNNNKDFVEKVKRLRETRLGQKDVVPILGNGEKKPPAWFKWTDYRDGIKTRPTDEEFVSIFSNPEVGRAAIMLDKASFVIDAEGEGLAIQQLLEQRMSPSLRDKTRTTRTTITPYGKHKHLLLSTNAYPDGIEEMLCWNLQTEPESTDKKKRRKSGEHAPGSGELRVLSQSKYAIEVGAGYEVMNPEYETAAELTDEESKEIVELYSSFKTQQDVIRMMIKGDRKESLLKYWDSESNRRHDTALGLAGTLWNTKVPENFTYDLIYYICKVTKDEEVEDRLNCVRDTYKNGRAGKEIAGFTKLLPALDGQREIIQKIYEGLETLGYKITRVQVTWKGSPQNRKYFGSVDDLERTPDDNRRFNTREGLGGVSTSKADIVIDICMPSVKAFFVDKNEVPFATVDIDNQLETLAIKRSKFKLWMRKAFYESQGEALNQTAMESALGVFESRATFSKQKKALALRVSDGRTDISGMAESVTSQQIVINEQSRMFYDLTNSKNQVIEITAEGWSIKESNQVPQMFYRFQSQQAQVMPSKNYPENIFDQFMDLTNTVVRDNHGTEIPEETKKMRLLLKCYVVGLFIPNIDRIILLLYGEQETGKTLFLELIKMLVDPSGALTLTFPRSMAEIIQQLSHNFIAYYDNVSILQDWLSDVLCRASTGTGFSKRQLYTDDDDIMYEFIRSVGISAIHLPGSKPDMLSRSLLSKFVWIREDLKRKKKEDILPIFYQIRPQVLGYIFDILVKAMKLKVQGGLVLETRKRMADWEEWCEIIARCMGYKEMEFINAYNDNTKLQSDLVLEDRPVARALVKLIEPYGEDEGWSGSNSALLKELDDIALNKLDLNIKSLKLWPKSPSRLSFRIGEIRPNLRELGIEIYETQDSKTRVKTLHIRRRKEVRNTPLVPLAPFAPSTESQSESKNPRSKDSIKDNTNGTNGANGVLHTSLSTTDGVENEKSPTSEVRKEEGNKTSLASLASFDINKVQIVNLMKEQCDILIARMWPKGHPNPPLTREDYLGNPYVILKEGQEPSKPWECKTREEALSKYKQWLYHGKEIIHHRDPGEYRRKALEYLPGHYKWGCFCAPEPCHGEILKKWFRRQLVIRKARATYRLKHSGKGSSTKQEGGGK